MSSNVTEGAVEEGCSLVDGSSGASDSVEDCKVSLVVDCCSLDGVRVGATTVASERWL